MNLKFFSFRGGNVVVCDYVMWSDVYFLSPAELSPSVFHPHTLTHISRAEESPSASCVCVCVCVWWRYVSSKCGCTQWMKMWWWVYECLCGTVSCACVHLAEVVGVRWEGVDIFCRGCLFSSPLDVQPSRCLTVGGRSLPSENVALCIHTHSPLLCTVHSQRDKIDPPGAKWSAEGDTRDGCGGNTEQRLKIRNT